MASPRPHRRRARECGRSTEDHTAADSAARTPSPVETPAGETREIRCAAAVANVRGAGGRPERRRRALHGQSRGPAEAGSCLDRKRASCCGPRPRVASCRPASARRSRRAVFRDGVNSNAYTGRRDHRSGAVRDLADRSAIRWLETLRPSRSGAGHADSLAGGVSVGDSTTSIRRWTRRLFAGLLEGGAEAVAAPLRTLEVRPHFGLPGIRFPRSSASLSMRGPALRRISG